MSKTLPIDQVLIRGDVAVRATRPDGSPVADPYSIFEDPGHARSLVPLGEDGLLDLSHNMVVNLGRQSLAYLIGGKDVNTSNWVVTQVSWGVYDEAPRFTDTTLSPQPGVTAGGENEILYDGVNRRKAITSVDWPVPFVTRFECLLGPDECNGYTLREMGLWTSNGVLFARKALVPIIKTSDLALSFVWSVRS